MPNCEWFHRTVYASCILFIDLFCFCVADKPLEGFHIVVDAGNGAGGFFVVSVILNLIFIKLIP